MRLRDIVREVIYAVIGAGIVWLLMLVVAVLS